MTPDSIETPTGVALVGHCGPDSWMLKSMVQRTLPNAEISMINSAEQLWSESATLQVLLINRVLEGEFPSKSGIELIRALTEKSKSSTVLQALLISNFPDAQAEAEAVGALPGFGKSELNQPAAADKLRAAFNQTRTSPAS